MRPVTMDRLLLEVVPEQRYGFDPGTAGFFPAYIRGEEMPQWDVPTRSTPVSRGTYGARRQKSPDALARMASLRTYVPAKATDDLESWLLLFEAAGLRRRDDKTWEAKPAVHTSLTVRAHMDGYRRVLTGCRSVATSLRGDVGRPVEVIADVVGLAGGDTPAALPQVPATSMGAAEFCNAELVIRVEGRADYRPAGLARIDLRTGTSLVQKSYSRNGTHYAEWRVSDCNPEFTCVFEADPARDWLADRGRRVEVAFAVGQDVRWDVTLPSLGIVGAARPVRLETGLQGWELGFQTVEGRESPLRIQRR